MTLSQKQLFESYLSSPEQRGSECAFSNLFVWRDCYHIFWSIIRDFLIVKVKRNDVDFYLQPFGGIERDLPLLIEDLKEAQHGHPFEMHGIYEPMKETLAHIFPTLHFIDDRDNWDYVYQREKLATLSGRKLHGQKNHYNAFMKMHPDYTYEPITKENILECMDFGVRWCDENMYLDPSLLCEKFAIQEAFLSFEQLELRGGAIRFNGQIQAFSFGKKINANTAVLHVEKARHDVRGLYTAMTKEFAEHAWPDVIYLNREEDMGHPGLRNAKESLHPDFMVKKYTAVFG